MFETIRREHGRLDFCINNAGLCHAAPILSGTTEQWKNMFEVSVMGLIDYNYNTRNHDKECLHKGCVG